MRVSARIQRRPLPKGPTLLALGLVACGVASCERPAPQSPEETLVAYARAVEQGRTRDAYALVSADARRHLTLQEFEQRVRDDPHAARAALRNSLGAGDPSAEVTATLKTANGHAYELELEDGEWRLKLASIDLYGQATPEAAIASFARAVERQRYDLLLRFVPSRQAEGLDEAKLREAWDGEQRADMLKLVRVLQASLPQASLEVLGERASMAFGAGGTVELVRENGIWKIEDIVR